MMLEAVASFYITPNACAGNTMKDHYTLHGEYHSLDVIRSGKSITDYQTLVAAAVHQPVRTITRLSKLLKL